MQVLCSAATVRNRCVPSQIAGRFARLRLRAMAERAWEGFFSYAEFFREKREMARIESFLFFYFFVMKEQ